MSTGKIRVNLFLTDFLPEAVNCNYAWYSIAFREMSRSVNLHLAGQKIPDELTLKPALQMVNPGV